MARVSKKRKCGAAGRRERNRTVSGKPQFTHDCPILNDVLRDTESLEVQISYIKEYIKPPG